MGANDASSDQVKATSSRPGVTKASVRIGTVHGRMNYKMSENAFHRNDMNEKNRQKKMAVKRWARKDVLGADKKEWDPTVGPRNVAVVRRMSMINKHDSTLFNYNYRAEVLPKSSDKFVPKCGRQNFDQSVLHKNLKEEHVRIAPAKRIEECPVHPALKDKVAWDHSTTFDRADDEKRSSEAAKQSVRFSRMKNKRLDKEGYMSPMERETRRMEKIRAARETKAERGDLASSQNDAQESKHADDNEDPIPDMQFKRKTPSRKYKEFYNDGVYEYSKIEERMVWSCSMNPNPEFRGSCYKVRNPEAWNWASP